MANTRGVTGCDGLQSPMGKENFGQRVRGNSPTPTLPAAVLIDNDGTLMDTEGIWFDVEANFARERGGVFTPEQALTFVGRPMSEISGALKEWTHAPESVDEITDILNRGVIERIASVSLPWRPGMEELVNQLADRKIPLGLVSSSTRQILDRIISRLPPGTFQVVVGSEDVTHLKPHPEPYLLAANTLGVDPSRAVVIEDSGAGIESGLRAGANVIGIPCMADLDSSPRVSRVASAHDLTVQDLEAVAQGLVIDRLE